MQISAIHPLSKSRPKFLLPLLAAGVRAGFPSPADDHLEGKLDLNDILIRNRASTFLVRAKGHSMIKAGIQSGDMLVVDKAVEATDGRVVVARLDGDLVVKFLRKKNGRCWLESANDAFGTIEVTDEEAVIWGVVTSSIHSL